MAIVVIGGQAKDIGKTSVVCGLIRSTPERRWLAIKISPHGHDAAVVEERDATAATDSSRYLAAGAVRALWVSTGEGQLAEVMPQIRAAMGDAGDVIVESNSVLEFLRPDLYAVVLNPAVADFKASALRNLECADALLVRGETDRQPDWNGVSLAVIEHIPTFGIVPPDFSSADFISFVVQKLERVGR